MKNPTLEQIKEMYPEGCEVSCAITNNDYATVKHDFIRSHHLGDFYINHGNFVHLYCKNSKKFATITKPAPKSLIKEPDSEMQRILKEYELKPLKLSPQNKNIKKDFNKVFNNRLEKMKEELIIDLIKYIDSL
jgi:hypothetical protein